MNYDSGLPPEQRDLIALVTSNRTIDRRSLALDHPHADES